MAHLTKIFTQSAYERLRFSPLVGSLATVRWVNNLYFKIFLKSIWPSMIQHFFCSTKHPRILFKILPLCQQKILNNWWVNLHPKSSCTKDHVRINKKTWAILLSGSVRFSSKRRFKWIFDWSNFNFELLPFSYVRTCHQPYSQTFRKFFWQ